MPPSLPFAPFGSPPRSARMRAFALRSAVLAACLGMESNAWAAPDGALPVRLTVRAKTCTTEAAFWDALARRTPRVRRAAAGEPAALVDIEIAREGARSIGRMRIIADA